MSLTKMIEKIQRFFMILKFRMKGVLIVETANKEWDEGYVGQWKVID